MRIISKRTLVEAGEKYGPDAANQLMAWHEEAASAKWKCFDDISQQYKSADALDKETVVFNICYNRYRLVVKIWYRGQEVYIKFVGTHAEYDRKDLTKL